VGRGSDLILRAVLFDPTGGDNNIALNDLIAPTLGWDLSSASAINNEGWIVGYDTNHDGDGRAFLLALISEPATLLLLGLGAVVLRKRRTILPRY